MKKVTRIIIIIAMLVCLHLGYIWDRPLASAMATMAILANIMLLADDKY